jgi:ATP:corrinoid adenosyltransferase
VVVTGNHLWPELADAADLISEIRAVKHYYPKATGVKGLDW